MGLRVKLEITRVEAVPFNIPQKEPFRIATGVIKSTMGVLARVFTDEGIMGIGEGAPLAMVTGETQEGVLSAINRFIAPRLVGEDPFNLERIEASMNETINGNPSAKAAVSMAIYDVVGKAVKKPIYKLLGGYVHDVPTDITIDIKRPEEMVSRAREILRNGFKIIKVKIGINPREDVRRVEAVREAVNDDVIIRVDANQGYNPKTAIRVIRKIEHFEIEFVEQPVPAWDIDGLAKVRRAVDTPIMADESVHAPEDLIKVIKKDAVDMVNIKLMKAGGIFKAKQIALIAEAAGIPCMIGCMAESRVAITAAAHLLASTRNIEYADLDSPFFLKEDPVKRGGVFYEEGVPKPPEMPGLGIEL